MVIYLIGYMGSGKTTVGKKLARLMNYNFIDLDDFFEERFRINIPDFFEKYDEEAFRKIESELLLESANWKDFIVSTGGGAPCFFDNMQMMNSHGISVYLQMPAAALSSRLRNAKRKRPLIAGKSEEDLKTFIEESLSQRETFYKQANIIFDAINCDVELLKTSILNHPSFQ